MITKLTPGNVRFKKHYYKYKKENKCVQCGKITKPKKDGSHYRYCEYHRIDELKRKKILRQTTI